MADTKQLKVIFTGDVTNLQAAFKTAEMGAASTGKSLEAVGAKMKSAGSEMSALGSSMTAAFTVPIIGVGIAAGKMAMDFQQQMTYVRTDAGDTTDDINKLSNSVLALAKTSQFGPDELAKGLYHLASLGLRGADAMNALNTAQQMASVGGADLESTSSALGAALVTGIKGVQNYSEAAGVLDATIGAGNMRMQDLVNALGTGALTVFKNAGLSITDFGAALATLTDNGMAADEAATRLKMTIAMMEAPSGPAVQAMNAIGLASNKLGMDMQTKGLIPALEDLQKHLLDTYGTTAQGKQKIAQALTQMFGGGRSSAAIQTLLDQMSRVSQKETQIGQQSGEFADKVAEQQQTAAAKMKTAWSTVQVDLIKLGGDILPTVAADFDDLTKKIDSLTNWWDNLSGSQRKFIEQTALMAAVAGPGLSILGKMVSTFGTMAKIGGMAYAGASKVFGLFAGGAGAAEGAAGIAEVGVGATEATGALAGLAAVLTGPVGLALGLTAITALGAYAAFNKFSNSGKASAATFGQMSNETRDYLNLAKELGVQVTHTASTVDMLKLSQLGEKDAAKMVEAAGNKVTQTHREQAAAAETLKQRGDELTKAQQNLNGAIEKYGAYSPQAQTAQQGLTSKQDAYNRALAQGATLQIQNVIHEGELRQAIIEHNHSVEILSGTERTLNGLLSGTLGRIASFGSTALAQVKGIATLQLHVGSLAKSWSTFDVTFQKQNTAVNDLLLGTSATLNRVQGQSDSVNSSLHAASNSAIQLGGNMSGTSLQGGKHAKGTNYAPGGWSLVGERGPEIVNLPRGSQVIPNDQSNQMMSGNTEIHVHINAGTVVGSNGMSELSSTIYRELQRLSRANGFNGALPNIGVSPTG